MGDSRLSGLRWRRSCECKAPSAPLGKREGAVGLAEGAGGSEGEGTSQPIQVGDYLSRSSGTFPPFSERLFMTCLCSHMFISAEPLLSISAWL